MQHLSFCDWLISLSIMSSRFIYVAAHCRISFFKRHNNIPACVCVCVCISTFSFLKGKIFPCMYIYKYIPPFLYSFIYEHLMLSDSHLSNSIDLIHFVFYHRAQSQYIVHPKFLPHFNMGTFPPIVRLILS